ncbi:MAG TPA: O-antigen ligase family protein [Verrucomicrobiae bacterium]|nr:O-antigen ligase family protein [Verrucomicrobiae bacterium]
MIRIIAALICVAGTAGLFWLDRDPKIRASKASWIPTLWIFIAASRNVSTWLRLSAADQADQYLEGSPLDRAILTVILGLGVAVLFARQKKVINLLRANKPILIYFGYCGLSVFWADYPDVSLKRWFRALGDVVMILVILSERDWFASLKRIFARLSFLLIPVSILFIRYYPELGRSYSSGGKGSWVGAATDKNALGMMCLIFGLAAIYRMILIYRGEEGPRKKRKLIALWVLIVMALYLLREANSATALSAFVMAGSVMILTLLYPWARKPHVLHPMVAAVLMVAVGALFLGVGSGLVQDLGRDSTLTGRTNIWHFALAKVTNPLLGAGFESFWLGDRLKTIEKEINQDVNQAHNGYLEIYLNLGWLGVILIAIVLITAYRRIVSAVRLQTTAASLRLAYLVVAASYNFTEAGFKMMNPVWIVFLLSAAITRRVPVKLRKAEVPVDSLASGDENMLTAQSAAGVPFGRSFSHQPPR